MVILSGHPQLSFSQQEIYAIALSAVYYFPCKNQITQPAITNLIYAATPGYLYANNPIFYLEVQESNYTISGLSLKKINVGQVVIVGFRSRT